MCVEVNSDWLMYKEVEYDILMYEDVNRSRLYFLILHINNFVFMGSHRLGPAAAAASCRPRGLCDSFVLR